MSTLTAADIRPPKRLCGIILRDVVGTSYTGGSAFSPAQRELSHDSSCSAVLGPREPGVGRHERTGEYSTPVAQRAGSRA